MNKPERPEVSSRAKLVHRVKNVGAKALRKAADTGESVWKSAADAPDEERRRKKILFLTGSGIGAVVAVLFVTSRLGGEELIETPASKAQAVSVITLQTRNLEATVSLGGEARPVRDIQVAAPATGVRILEILVDEGDTVREGQVMARLDTSLATAQTRAAQAAVVEAEASAVQARSEYERADSIRDSGALSREALEQRRTAAITADARLAAARAQLSENNTRLGGGFVRAPASGLVIDRMAELGRPVDGQVLFRIAADNRLEVSAQVAEVDALSLQTNQVATFALVDGSTVQATLRRLSASIDSRTRTGEALFTLPADTRVQAGMYLRGHVELPPRNVIAAPQSSVLYDNGHAFVFVLDDTNHVRRTEVHLGSRDGDWVEVTQGLAAGHRIVGSGAAFLQDGEEVRALQRPDGTALQRTAADAGTPSPTDIRGRE
jgi:RND family efflux transporter MFP subunit